MSVLDSWEQKSRSSVFRHPVLTLDLVRCARGDGREKDFVVLGSPDWVNVVPLTADGRVVLIKQFRVGANGYTLEIPGGLVDPGELPIQAAAREMLEETGYASDDLVYLGKVNPNPALFENICHTFLARGVRRAADQALDEDEMIEVFTVPVGELPAMVRDGRIDHSLVVAALTFFWLNQGAVGPTRA